MGSSLGAYTDPVEICRCWLRSVAFDGAFKVAVVHGRDQFCIHLQQRFAAGEHNETLLCRPSPGNFYGLCQCVGGTETAATNAFDAQETGIAELAARLGSVGLPSGPEL